MQTERDFQAQVIQLAQLWSWLVHAERPARTKDGWKTAIEGDAGFPDLVLVRPPRVIAIELKSEGGKVTPHQAMWLEALASAGVEVHVFRPGDWPSIEEALR